MSSSGGPSGRRIVPRLHVVTAPDHLEAEDFPDRARAILRAGGVGVALHLRAPGASGRLLYERAWELVDDAEASGARLLVNDRVDVVRAVGAHGAQLGGGSLPPADARGVLGSGALMGVSVHDPGAARSAAGQGADFLLVGTIYPSATHPGRPGAGPALLERVARGLREDRRANLPEEGIPPLVAIGGVDPGRVPEVMEAGAAGVAVVRAVWDSGDPAAETRELLRILDRSRTDLHRGEP